MVRSQTLQLMGHASRVDEDCLPRQDFDCSSARSVAKLAKWNNSKVPRGRPWWWHHFLKLTGRTNESLGQEFEQRRRNVPWTGRPGGTLSKPLLQWNKA
eukprot:364735-Chlamydomonas_euryale.AAC.11